MKFSYTVEVDVTQEEYAVFMLGLVEMVEQVAKAVQDRQSKEE